MASDTFVLEKSRLLIIGQQLFHFGACELRCAELGRQAKTPATSIEMMDKAGVTTSMLSPVLRVVMDSMG
jgi:hypothetical protein